MPLLTDVLATVPESVPLNLELKRWRASRARLAETLAGALAGRARPLVVSSFDWELLDVVSGLLPALPLAPLGRARAQALLGAAERLSATSVHCHRRLGKVETVSCASD